MKKIIPILLVIFLLQVNVYSQKTDTIYIEPKHINTKVLIPGTHRWLVYFKMGADSPRTMFNIWSRTINKITHNGKDAIEVTQVWEDKDSILHTTRSVSDAKDFRTLFHQSWWRQRGSSQLDFATGELLMNNKIVTKEDTGFLNKRVRNAFDKALPRYTLNWHLDLEVFPLLPYKDNVTFLINYYDPGSQEPKWVPYTVTGSAKLSGLDGQMADCWLLEHSQPNNKEVFWISKKTKEVLKLEQQFGTRYRYKIKLPFSN